MHYELLGLGNALLDYQIQVPFEFLKKLSLTKGSMTLVEQDFQQKLFKEIESSFGSREIFPSSGGCSANTLAGFSNFGGSGIFVGKVGADSQGSLYASDLENCGVKSHLSVDKTGRTGTCIALITPDAERTMLTHLGVAGQLSEQDISAELVDRSASIYIEGYLWDPPSGRKASLKAMQMAEQKNRPIAFTFSDSFCVDRHFDDFLSLAKEKITILFCNEDEAKRATKKSDVKEAFREIKDWCDSVCITTGAHGALLSDAQRGITEEIPTWDVKLVDKMGAGDMFAAGFMFGFLRNKSLRECGFLGCYSATRVIQQFSARLAEDLKPQIEGALLGPLKTPPLKIATP